MIVEGSVAGDDGAEEVVAMDVEEEKDRNEGKEEEEEKREELQE